MLVIRMCLIVISACTPNNGNPVGVDQKLYEDYHKIYQTVLDDYVEKDLYLLAA